MRQTTLTAQLHLVTDDDGPSSSLPPMRSRCADRKVGPHHRRKGHTEGGRARETTPGIQSLVDLLLADEPLVWHAVIPFGTRPPDDPRSLSPNTLKCIAELLLRCAPQTPISVDHDGIVFVACDQGSGRLIHILLSAEDLIQFQFHSEKVPFRCTLETSSLHAVFHQLKRKDTVVLYANTQSGVGSLVDYSGKRPSSHRARWDGVPEPTPSIPPSASIRSGAGGFARPPPGGGAVHGVQHPDGVRAPGRRNPLRHPPTHPAPPGRGHVATSRAHESTNPSPSASSSRGTTPTSTSALTP